MVILDVVSLLIPTFLLFSQVRKPLLDKSQRDSRDTWMWMHNNEHITAAYEPPTYNTTHRRLIQIHKGAQIHSTFTPASLSRFHFPRPVLQSLCTGFLYYFPLFRTFLT